ncbi:MAG: NAD-dependent epimerase/dehydratase family protein [Sphingobacteriales bacterium]|nr:MAG: NAD-dependent epimerase/dehydratase family protein [Sphingobacteriales bacterium]
MILVTGASGFLGQHLLEALAQQPLPVVGLYHSREPKTTYPNLTWKKCDLLDIFAVAEAMQGISHVYHCAAIVSYDPRMRDKMIRENVAATANVADAALEAGVHKLIHVSSIAALGRTPIEGSGALISEETHWEESKANSSYSESKYSSLIQCCQPPNPRAMPLLLVLRHFAATVPCSQ